MKNFKRRLALAGISTKCYTVDDMEMVEQFKTTNKYKKWKADKEDKRKKALRKKSYKEAFEDAYGDYTPSYLKFQFSSKPRFRSR